jgi:histidyl-tRNA synthetase
LPAVPAFKAPPGTFDVLAPASARYEALVARFAALAERAGYGLVISPMFEEVAVFQRVGESTDVVRKEMYDFEDKGGRRIALRPEGTASVVRAWVQHRPALPFKAWYAAPSFRYEAPQAGRTRQHHQLGVEALGTEDADLDVEVIGLLADFYIGLGLTKTTLRLTSLGDNTCRPAYRAELEAFLEKVEGHLCAEHKPTWKLNPLRVLDCKTPECLEATKDAPLQADRLCAPCEAHFGRVREGLSERQVDYVIDMRLVRGLDYYTRTTFEVTGDAMAGAQNGIGGGGRYDGLAEALGGPPTPGIGFGTGIERVLLACESEGIDIPVPNAIDVFVVDTTGGDAARRLTHELRAAGIRADRAWDQRSFKAQFKAADRSGAQLALVVGADEAERGVVAIKRLRDDRATDDTQAEFARADIVDHVKGLLA